MILDDRRERIQGALLGLVPIAWMERVLSRAADRARPRLEEMRPEPGEGAPLADILVIADTFVAGGTPSRKGGGASRKGGGASRKGGGASRKGGGASRKGGGAYTHGSALAALAKGIVLLACCPGGVKIFGHYWEAVEEDGIARMEDAPVARLGLGVAWRGDL